MNGPRPVMVVNVLTGSLHLQIVTLLSNVNAVITTADGEASFDPIQPAFPIGVLIATDEIDGGGTAWDGRPFSLLLFT